MSAGAMDLGEGWRELEAKRNSAIWWLHFPDFCERLRTFDSLESASVTAVLLGLGNQLPDGWSASADNEKGGREFDLGIGLEWVAANAAFVRHWVRAATRALGDVPAGTMRRAGTVEEIPFSDYERWVPALEESLQTTE